MEKLEKTKRRIFTREQKTRILEKLDKRIKKHFILLLLECMVAGEADMVYKGEITKEELWDKYYIQVPVQLRQPVEKYKIVKRV